MGSSLRKEVPGNRESSDFGKASCLNSQSQPRVEQPSLFSIWRRNTQRSGKERSLPAPDVPRSSSVSPPSPTPACLKLPTGHCPQAPKCACQCQMLPCRKDHWRPRSQAPLLPLHGVSSDPEFGRADGLWRVSGARRLCPNSRSLLGKVRNLEASQEVGVPKLPLQSLKVCYHN